MDGASSYDVLGVGQCTLDRLGVVDSYPAPDEKREFAGLLEQCGGPALTALVALRRWGRRCAFAGVVGDDAEGARIRADLAAEGVEAPGLLVRPGTRSQTAFVLVERGTGRRLIFWQRPTGAPPRPAELPAPRARILLSDGLYAEASLALARGAERVVADAGTLREGTEALLGVAHVFVASEPFARAFAGADDPAGACRKMRERGVEVAGVTLGARGYVALFGTTLLVRPAHPAEAVDTTGCGDVFHAALCEGMLREWPWERSFDFAAWAAARAAERLGNRAGLPRVEEYASML